MKRTTADRSLAAVAVLAVLALASCQPSPPQALGTVEWERITVPAPVAEPVLALEVREGQRVAAGDLLLRLDQTRQNARLEALRSQARRAREQLAELRAGPRSETIAQARARRDAARARLAEAEAQYRRAQSLTGRQLVSRADLDRARAARDGARAELEQAGQALLELEHGPRAEHLAQAEAALAAAEAEVTDQEALLAKLSPVAPRAGLVDSLPYKAGDQAPVGAPLAVLLVGEAPHARVYLPAALRARVAVGDRALVRVEGREEVYEGRLLMIRSQPSFTPYYALAGDDAERLSYLAEIQLGTEAATLPAGLPAQAEFPR
ncbi:HlyD family secretion protein [Arenimonas fontis]|uniref:Biotin/lipoyl-binding protein n=1 Tax=Arenimonas fontis TaxID=2608255 RepID=A0A5B2ZA59_9GAMM|nr:biotin/lipoyl-binding protein [Arenimonas fontis]KAA2284815.1 biotin/lipoyl-binding protein [Arenimonas fontis]